MIELPLSQTPPSIPQPDETRSPTSRARVAAEEDSRLVATSVYEVLGELRAAALELMMQQVYEHFQSEPPSA